MIDWSVYSWRFLRVWERNLVVYQKIWKVNFITPLLEPLFYILAFGLGFSGLIGTVHYAGLALSYTAFIAPAPLRRFSYLPSACLGRPCARTIC